MIIRCTCFGSDRPTGWSPRSGAAARGGLETRARPLAVLPAGAAYPERARLLAANHVLVGPMRAIEPVGAAGRPARRAWLVERLLADVEQEPGALPLLSTALLEL